MQRWCAHDGALLYGKAHIRICIYVPVCRCARWGAFTTRRRGAKAFSGHIYIYIYIYIYLDQTPRSKGIIRSRALSATNH